MKRLLWNSSRGFDRAALSRTLWMLVASFLGLGSIAITPSLVWSEQPNIVVLYSDDAGYADFGFQPSVRDDMKSLTPFIDTIARDGVRLSNAYMAGCVCSPSRAALMTGRYQSRFGFDDNLPPGTKNGLPLSETFGSKRLQSLGYRTGLVGKWHLGYPERFHPNRRGWDWFYGCLQGSRSYFPIKKPTPHRVFLENATPTPEGGYTTDRIGDAACRFIKENKEKPFYLFVSFTAPHGPLQPKQEDLTRLAHIENEKRKKYAGLVVALDDNIGKILKTLADENLDQKTLVVFTNDNGGQTRTGANNAPLRGAKGSLFEGGVRVPWAMRWSGKIAPKSVINDPIMAIDLLPTFVEAAGGSVAAEWKLDGISLLRRLTGEVEALPKRTLYWRKGGPQGTYAVREGKWKMIVDKSKGGQTMLFDLSVDVSEQQNVAEESPEIVKSLTTKMDHWSHQLVPPLWGPSLKSKKGKSR